MIVDENIGPNQRSSIPFRSDYRCYSIRTALQNRVNLEDGDRVFLPPSALDHLTVLNIPFPMFFKITTDEGFMTHCGVIEFTAQEGLCYIPSWIMMHNLGMIEEESISLPDATFARFQPLTQDFLDIYDHKAVLENSLRTHSCLTEGDMKVLKYNDKMYELRVLTCEPTTAVSIIECDMSVDFAEPLIKDDRYRETIVKNTADGNDDDNKTNCSDDDSNSRIFKGTGYRLGRANTLPQSLDVIDAGGLDDMEEFADYDFHLGTLIFDRTKRKKLSKPKAKKESEPFDGKGHLLGKPI